jgi:hypothetical protein
MKYFLKFLKSSKNPTKGAKQNTSGLAVTGHQERA